MEFLFEEYVTHWVTIDGQKLLPHEMSTEHLKNAKKMMERCLRERNTTPEDLPIYKLIVGELGNRE